MELSKEALAQSFPADGPSLLNIGYGDDISIRNLAEVVSKVLGYEGSLVFDVSKPDGTPRKLIDSAGCGALAGRPRWTLPPEYGLRLRLLGQSSMRSSTGCPECVVSRLRRLIEQSGRLLSPRIGAAQLRRFARLARWPAGYCSSPWQLTECMAHTI